MEMEYNYESNRVGIYTQTSVEATAAGAGFAPSGEKSPVAMNPYMRQTNEYSYGANVGNAPHFDQQRSNNFGNMSNAPTFDQRSGNNFGNMGNTPHFDQHSANNYGNMGIVPQFDPRVGNNFGNMGNAAAFGQQTGNNFGNMGSATQFDQRFGNNFGNIGNAPLFDQRSGTNFGNMGSATHFNQGNFGNIGNAPHFEQSGGNSFGNMGNAPHFDQRSGNNFGNMGSAPHFAERSGDRGSVSHFDQRGSDNFKNRGSSSNLEHRSSEIFNRRNVSNFDQRSSDGFDNRRNAPSFSQRSSDGFDNRRNAPNFDQRSSDSFENRRGAPDFDQRSSDSFESTENSSYIDQRSCDSFRSKGNTSHFEQRSSESFGNSANPFKKDIEFSGFQGSEKKKSKKQKKKDKYFDPHERRAKLERSRAIAASKNIPSSLKQYPQCEEFFGHERWRRAMRTLRKIGYNTWEMNAMLDNLDLMLREGKLENVERPELPSDDEEDEQVWHEPFPKKKKKNKQQSQNTGNSKASTGILKPQDRPFVKPVVKKIRPIQSEEVYEEPDLSKEVEEEVKGDNRVFVGDASHPNFQIPPKHRNDVVMKINQVMWAENKSIKRKDQHRNILNFAYINGKLLVVCKNTQTVEFIESVLIEVNKLWEGANLVLCPRLGIRKKIQICIKDCDFSTEEMLTIISKQNAMDTSKWAVVKRTTDKNTTYLDVVIDPAAYVRLFVDQEDLYFIFTRALIKELN